MNEIFLGIDTSNYTTSVAAYLSNGKHINVKVPLCVKPHERGVRQSDAVFMHTKNIPEATSTLFSKIREQFPDGFKIKGVGVSTRPRSVEGSYMPCFLTGVSVACAIANAENAPLFEFSHQDGHIRAALFGANLDLPERFYSFHLSGGTTELLYSERTDSGFKNEIISETADITLGQLIDRTGVMMGLQFPAGKALEDLALLSDKRWNVKISGKERINLSGFENKTLKMYEDNTPKEDIAGYVFEVVFKAVERMLENRADKSLPVVFSGGVSSSKKLRLEAEKICDAHFASPDLSADNAVGVAILTKEKFLLDEH